MKQQYRTWKLYTAVIFSLILLLNLTITIPAQPQGQLSPSDERIKTHLSYLASDELEGRFPGTDGIRKAADYIENYFKSVGVQPLGSTYRQHFNVSTGLKLGQHNDMFFEVLIIKEGIPKEMNKPQKRSWALNSDWQPVKFSESGTVSGELVFAGYGVTDKDLNYDDYEGIDVKGKIVIILSDSSERTPKDHFLMKYSELRYKASNARDHGAAGVIFVKMISDSASTFYPLRIDIAGKNSGIIAVQANRTSIAKFFPKSKNLYPVELEINDKKKPNSFSIPNITVTITTDIEDDQKETDNVVGLIPGTDPKLKDEYIVIGAHYDHLGWGGVNSLYMGSTPMIHNGADDNASGTSGLLELAYRLKEKPIRRNVILIAFSGEELGLLGSEYYVKNPLIPLEKDICMLNMDMIGRLKNNTVSLFGLGTSPFFEKICDTLAVLSDLSITKAQDGFGPSDHASFYKHNLPVLMFITGVHEDYHKPSDKVDKINFPGETKVLDYVERILRRIDDEPLKPEFTKVNSVTDNLPPADGKKGYGAWFGIIPNFEENPKGCKISGASPGSPAMKAGLKENDIITHFGDKSIKNLYDLTYSLREHKPGDKISVTLLRGDNEIKIDVTLGQRR